MLGDRGVIARDHTDCFRTPAQRLVPYTALVVSWMPVDMDAVSQRVQQEWAEQELGVPYAALL